VTSRNIDLLIKNAFDIYLLYTLLNVTVGRSALEILFILEFKTFNTFHLCILLIITARASMFIYESILF